MGSACSAVAARGVARLVHGVPASDGAGLRLTRVIGTSQLDQLDPFLLLDEIRSDRPGHYIAGVPSHPHRGFEALTYMLAGRLRHGDNHGNQGLLEGGGAQWLTAGRGLVRFEKPEPSEGLMWGFRLWINLPARDKMVAPRCLDIPPSAVPEIELANGVMARVIAGQLEGVTGPASKIAAAPSFFDLRLAPGAHALVPVAAADNAFLYVYQGALVVQGEGRSQRVAERELAVLLPGEALAIGADVAGARALLAVARPLAEPVARYGPFVMNTRDELMQAVSDFQAGRF